MLTKFQFHCSITCRNILYFVLSLPYCHTLWHHQYLICIIQKLWISLERYEIWQKWKHHSSSLLKAFQINLFFNTSIFHFIGTLRYQCTPKLTILPNFSYWYCQVHLIEFFQLQKVLRKMVSFRQSYNEKTILWINYLYLEAVNKLSWSIKVPLKVT